MKIIVYDKTSDKTDMKSHINFFCFRWHKNGIPMYIVDDISTIFPIYIYVKIKSSVDIVLIFLNYAEKCLK